MSKTDFQNGFALGVASSGKIEIVNHSQLTAEAITTFKMETSAYEEVDTDA